MWLLLYVSLVLSTGLLVCISTRDWLSGVLVLLLLCTVELHCMEILRSVQPSKLHAVRLAFCRSPVDVVELPVPVLARCLLILATLLTVGTSTLLY